MGNLTPPSFPPRSSLGKWRVLAFAQLRHLFGGWGFAVPFYFVQDCRPASVKAFQFFVLLFFLLLLLLLLLFLLLSLL